MNKKLDIHNFWRSNIFIILMFFTMSLLSALMMWHHHYVGIGLDGYFHTQRIYDLQMSFRHGDFLPLVALSGFGQNGSAVMAMYPKIVLFPVVLLSYCVKSVVPFVYITFILRNFVSLIVSYYSSYKFNKSKKISFIFSTVYTLNSMVLFYAISAYSVGRTATFIFLPMILFGFYDLLDNDNWLELSVGMSIIIFSHVINTAIVIVFLTLLLIINYRKINVKQFTPSLIKSILITALITSSFWIPFLLLYCNNKIWIPQWTTLSGVDFVHLLSLITSNEVDSSTISVFGLIGFILACVCYKKLSVYLKQMFWVAIFMLILVSQLFPWNILNSTFIKDMLQFPWRFLIIPQLLLCYLFADLVIKLSNNSSKKIIVCIVCVISTLVLQLSAQKNIVDNTINNPELSNSFDKNHNVYYKLFNNDDLNNLVYANNVINDYYPVSSINSSNDVSNHIATYDNGKRLSVSILGNGKFLFNSPQKISKLSLPFLYYNGIDYQVKLDGKTVKGYPNKNALMTINNVHKGKHRVQIIVHKAKAEIASYILSLIGLLILIFVIIKNFLKKRKIE